MQFDFLLENIEESIDIEAIEKAQINSNKIYDDLNLLVSTIESINISSSNKFEIFNNTVILCVLECLQGLVLTHRAGIYAEEISQLFEKISLKEIESLKDIKNSTGKN